MRQGYFSRSWGLFQTSWHVLRQDRELLWLAVINLAVGLAFALAAGVIVLVAGILASAGSLAGDSWWEVPHPFIFFLAGLLFTVGATLSNTFFHGAIVYGALERLSGGDPTVRSALAGARARFKQLMLWGLMTLAVAWLIRIIEHLLERVPYIGWLLSWLWSTFARAAWAVLTFLTLPIVIVEGLGPSASLSRSYELLKRTWGENLIVQVGLGLVGFVLMLPGLFVIVLFAASGAVPAIVVGAILGGLYLVGVMLFISALNSVLQSALYHYAVKGEVPAGFAGHDFSTAFAPKKESKFSRFLRS